MYNPTYVHTHSLTHACTWRSCTEHHTERTHNFIGILQRKLFQLKIFRIVLNWAYSRFSSLSISLALAFSNLIIISCEFSKKKFDRISIWVVIYCYCCFKVVVENRDTINAMENQIKVWKKSKSIWVCYLLIYVLNASIAVTNNN